MLEIKEVIKITRIVERILIIKIIRFGLVTYKAPNFLFEIENAENQGRTRKMCSDDTIIFYC